MIPVFVLFGPTASGKTGMLEYLFAGSSPLFRAEIISADSMQVYRHCNIGTAKPPPELLKKLPHHLIDIRNPDEPFNVGDFVRLASETVEDIWNRGALPVISGGTGFYLKNIIMGLPESPPSDLGIRAEIKAALAQNGAAALVEELMAADPVSAGRIHINDTYRLTRALEVYRLTGRPLSSYAEHLGTLAGKSNGFFRFLLVSLRRPREQVYRRIDERCAQMFRDGLPAEVEKLCAMGYGPGDPAMRAIGYREFFVQDEGSADDGGKVSGFHISQDLNAVQALVARNSRRYAKRQLTFFASIPGVTSLDVCDDTPEQINDLLAGFQRDMSR